MQWCYAAPSWATPPGKMSAVRTGEKMRVSRNPSCVSISRNPRFPALSAFPRPEPKGMAVVLP
jgi:hypothetical protein